MAIINFNNMFFLNIYLFLLYFCLCETDFDYNRKKRLNNGNYLIMSTQGIYLYNEYFNRKKNLTIFESRLANSISEIYSSDIDQFLSEDNGYIICLIKNETYFLSRNGALLQHITLDYIIETLYYNIIPYGYLNNEYYYVIINIESQKIMIRKYIYDSLNNNINFKKSYIYNVSESTKNGITCELMYYNIDNKVITCFYGDWKDTFYIVLNTTDFSLISGYGGKISNEGGINGGNLFVSSIIPNKRDVVMICSQHSGNYECFLYNITNNNFTSAVTIEYDLCVNDILNMVVEYFPETDEFLVACKGYLNNLYIGKFSSNYTYKIYGKINIREITGCFTLNLFHFIFSSNGNYSIVVDMGECLNEGVISSIDINLFKFNDYPTDEIGILICEKYYNYEGTECIDKIPDGYYCNDTLLGTIDKCHENCKTCNIGPTNDNNNCLTCSDNNTIYFDLGNCKTNCENGFYIENYIKKCNCPTNITCEICSLESKQYNLCLKCNTKLGYYPKIDDIYNVDDYINCYNESTISEGYYLNNETNQYELCYNSCSKCYGLGDEDNNNCKDCKSVYFSPFIDKNCYPFCQLYYYFDSKSKFHCVENCPNEYKKVYSTKLCISNCSGHYSNKFEYNNICFENCPDGTIPLNNNICVDEKNKFNHEMVISCPYLISETNICVKECNVSDFFQNKCKTKEQSEKIKEENILKIKNAITSHSIDSLLDNITNGSGKDLLIEEKNIKYQITSSTNQNIKEYDDISIIKLGECEKELKDFYKIDKNESLIILKLDVYYEGLFSPIVIYEIYHPSTKERLDLMHCENFVINLSLPVKINESELYKHDPNNEFYNDICSTFTTDNGTDITLNDRQNVFIDNNYSLCEDGCKYNGYDFKTKKASCECLTKVKLPMISEIKIDKEKLKKNFIDIKSLININIMKCYKKLFTREGLISNTGSYILLSILFIYIISSNLFFIIEYDIIYDKIKAIIKFKKQKNIDSMNNFIHNDVKQEINIFEKNNNINIIGKQKKIYKKKKKKKRIKTDNNNIYNIVKINDLMKNNIKNAPPSNKGRLKSQTFYSKKLENSHFDSINSKLNINISGSNISGNVINIKDIKDEQFNNIDLKKQNLDSNVINYNDYELNNMKYNDALSYDKRTYFQYYWSLLRTKHILIFAFVPSNDYNSTIIKICLFLFSFALYYTVNALFFNDSTLHEIYVQEGEYDFIYQLPQIIYSTIISSFINFIIKFFSLSQGNVLKIKNGNITDNYSYKKRKLLKLLRLKFIWFFKLSIIFLLLFWYYLACFCAIYKNTQIHLLKDTIISFILSLIYPICIYLIPGIFRINSLKKKSKCLYTIGKITQIF